MNYKTITVSSPHQAGTARHKIVSKTSGPGLLLRSEVEHPSLRSSAHRQTGSYGAFNILLLLFHPFFDCSHSAESRYRYRPLPHAGLLLQHPAVTPTFSHPLFVVEFISEQRCLSNRYFATDLWGLWDFYFGIFFYVVIVFISAAGPAAKQLRQEVALDAALSRVLELLQPAAARAYPEGGLAGCSMKDVLTLVKRFNSEARKQLEEDVSNYCHLCRTLR